MMNRRLPTFFSFLLLFSTPLAGEAQTRCRPTRESVVEIMPDLSIIEIGRARVEPVAQHLSTADRVRVTSLVRALLERFRMPCGHHVRVRFNYRPFTRSYEAHLSIRQPQDRCWEQVQCNVGTYDGTRIETPSGTSPAAAIVSALTNGDLRCTTRHILCPSDPQP